MSLLFLSFIIQAALASGQMGPLKDFEEGVLSNNITPKPSDDIDHPLAEPEQEIAATTSQSEIPPELASLEAAVFEKYPVTNLADLESAGIAKHKVEAPSSESQEASGLKLRKAHPKAKAHSPESQKGSGLNFLRRAHHKHHKVEAHSLESQKGSGLKVRKAHHNAKAHSPESPKRSGLKLRRAHHKRHEVEAHALESQKGSGLKVRKAHPKVKAHSPETPKRSGFNFLRRAHHKHHKVEAHSLESQKGSGLKVRKAHPKVKTHSPESQKGSGLKLRRAHHKQLDVEAHPPESQKVSGLKVREHKHNVISKRKHKRNAPDSAQTPSDASQKARFKLKRMTPLHEAPKEVIGTFGQITRAAPSPVQEVEGKEVSKNVSMQDTLNYPNQGATMHHAKPTLRKSMTPEQVSLAWEEGLAKEKSNKPSRFRATKAAPDSILTKLTQCMFFLAGLCSIAGIAYHKYQVIAEMYAGNVEPEKFKAKGEDMYGFAPAPCFSPQVTTGSHMSAVVGSCHQGLSRRGATDTTRSYEFGV